MLGACVYCMCTAIGINLLSHSFKPIRLNYYCPHLVTAETNQKQKTKKQRHCQSQTYLWWRCYET